MYPDEIQMKELSPDEIIDFCRDVIPEVHPEV
jgi:hypothetical protein